MRRYPDYKYRPKKKAKELAAAAAAAAATATNQQQQGRDAKLPVAGTNINHNNSNGIIKLVPTSTFQYKTTSNQNKAQIAKTMKPQVMHNVLRKEHTKLVSIASRNGQCVMASGKPFLTLSRQVGKIGSLSSSDGNFSVSPQKTILPKTSLHQQIFRANPLTPPPNVPESLASPVEGENNLSFYEDLYDFKKRRCDSSSSLSDFQTAPVWTQSDGSDYGFDLPVSPLSDIMLDVPALYTTPEVSELLSGQWLDGSLGF